LKLIQLKKAFISEGKYIHFLHKGKLYSLYNKQASLVEEIRHDQNTCNQLMPMPNHYTQMSHPISVLQLTNDQICFLFKPEDIIIVNFNENNATYNHSSQFNI